MEFHFNPNMMHEQQINNMVIVQEVYNICTEHVECVSCPLKGGIVTNVQGINVVCDTGRGK